jgi:hypothetical protein
MTTDRENKYIYIGDYNPTANGHDASVIQFLVTKPKKSVFFISLHHMKTTV